MLSEIYSRVSNPNKFIYYVYQLIDPRTLRVFYVGKGKKKRIDDHEAETAKGVSSKKCNKIRSITDSGFRIIKTKVHGFEDEQLAYDYETDLISYYGLENLTNVLPGGQKVWTRRKEKRIKRYRSKQREKDSRLPWEMVVSSAWLIADWVRVTNFGSYTVKANLDGSESNLQKSISHMTAKAYNTFVKDIFFMALKDKDHIGEVVTALDKYGIKINVSAQN